MVPSQVGVRGSIVESNLKKPVAMARSNRVIDFQASASAPSSIRQLTASTISPTSKAETTGTSPSQFDQGTLQELSIAQIQNSSIAPVACQNQDFKPIKHSSRGLRRRAPIDPFIFEPLDAVQEESSLLSGSVSVHAGAPTAVTCTARDISSAIPLQSHNTGNRNENHPLYTVFPERPKRHQVERHLAATPIEGDALILPDLDAPQSPGDMAADQPPAYEYHQTTPLKVPEVEVAEVADQAVSPSLTLISDRSSSYAGGSSRAGSFSVPRIEDSLEELDKLEDELEAVNAFAHQGRLTSPPGAAASPKCLEPPQIKKSGVSKRASMSGLSATVRIKQSEKAQPPIRRSTSLVFRNKEAQESPRLRTQLSRSLVTETKAPKPAVKSTKAPTVPNFELPGEAVARRLKEQREARLAQQAEAQKAYVPPPRPKSKKPLTKPAFELPGEAISRRKREEREARLKALEEEEKKRREFKARPLRVSSTPSTMPRETATSRARQGKPLHDDESEKKKQEAKPKRFSVPSLRRSKGPPDGKVAHARGRLSDMASEDNLSRGTSTSAGSASSKRNTLTAEDAQQLRLKGKQIFERDNTSYIQDKEREKREREAAARAARAEAAERSRVASREWAEKKRLKLMATLQPKKQSTQPTARSMVEG